MALLSAILVTGGLYLLILLNAPTLIPTKKLSNIEVAKENRVIIKKINVNREILEGDNSVLEKGVWHRYPERGDPEMGGNFILTGHRFKFAQTPNLVKEASVFYDINKLVTGDEIEVHWNGKKYKYRIEKIYKVKPNQTEIENVSESRLTLYSCTLSGSSDGREVIEAKLVK